MINLEELKSSLKEVMHNKDAEAAMASVININCNVPQELNGFLTDFLNLKSDEIEALDALYKLDRKQIVVLATLAMIANGRTADFIKLERNMLVLKICTTKFLTENAKYRETSIDDNENSIDGMLMALTKMKEILSIGKMES